MFLVWDPNGSHTPYAAGVIRRRRVAPVAGVAAVSRDSGDASRGRDRGRDRGGARRERPERALTAAQIMSTPVVTLEAAEPLEAVAELFRRRRFRHVPIVAPGGRVVGIISDRDLLRHAAPTTGGTPASPGRAGEPGSRVRRPGAASELMATPVLSAAPETEIREVARVLLEERIGSMPIVADGGVLRGILTRTDILRALVRHGPFDLWV